RRADHVDRASSRSGGTRSAREAQGRAGPRRPLRILAIETSCDETGVAIVEDGRRIVANVVASQLVHQDTGGIVPEVAAREHLRTLDAITVTALKDAAISLRDVDAVAATVGPGLTGCLLVGANYGRGLALAAGLPFVGVNHLEGHVYANWLYEGEAAPPEPEIPAIVLVVSGAHSDLVLMEGHRRHTCGEDRACRGGARRGHGDARRRRCGERAASGGDRETHRATARRPATAALYRQRRDDRRRGLLRAASSRH